MADAVNARCEHHRAPGGPLDGGGAPARYDGIQVLRALAALSVLAAHASFVAPASWGWLDAWSHGGGAIGVDVFFVVSGFVVAMSADRAGVTAGGFLADRATRVLPPYLVFSMPFLLTEKAATWPALWNTFAFLPLFDGATYTAPAHPFGWSVGMELWFYLVFAAVIRFAPRGRRIEALAAVAVLLAAAGWMFGGDRVLFRFAGTPLVLEFVGGAALYRLRHTLGRHAAAAALLAPLGCALVCCAAVGFAGFGYYRGALETSHVGWARAAIWGGPALLLVAGVVALDHRGVRWPAPLVKVGDWSYSVYLVQAPAITVLGAVAADGPHWLLAWAALLALVLVLAHVGHRYVERPITAWLRALLRARGVGAAPWSVRAAAGQSGGVIRPGADRPGRRRAATGWSRRPATGPSA